MATAARPGDGSEAGTDLRRATICVSSQIGCAVNCQFCLTAKMGIQRNLTAGEIAGQVVAVLKRHKVEIGQHRINLVFMGMGEPFLNYDEFMAAVRLLVEESRHSRVADDGFDFGDHPGHSAICRGDGPAQAGGFAECSE